VSFHAALGMAALAACVARPACGQTPRPGLDGWRDTTHHVAGFVRVATGVHLHYLDFGGHGPTVVCLAGLGNTAHAFDGFAPGLADRFHVVALTRRGFGESDHPSRGYDTPRLVEDIRHALDALRLGRVTLVGHSIASEEMTRFAATYPERVDRLVYLEGAYDRVAADSMVREIFPVAPDVGARPQPTAADTATPAAYVAFVHRTRGVNIPESDIRARYRYDGWNEEITPAYQSIAPEHPDYRAVRAPALAIYAVTDTLTQLEPWQRGDRAHAVGLQALIRGIEVVERASREQFRREVTKGQVLEIHGAHHWIFVSDRDTVLAAVRRFLLQPRTGRAGSTASPSSQSMKRAR
jgi:pimeloyl-ACP methyl ester carboxylesterase